MGVRFAGLGSYFAVEQGSVAPEPWLPIDLLAGRGLDQRIRATRAALRAAQPDPDREVPLRIAASIAQLGVAARLSAPALAAAVSAEPLTGRLYYQDRYGGPFPLAELSDPAADRPIESRWPEALMSLVRPVVQATVEGAYGLSAVIAWGNVASGLAGAAKMHRLAEPSSAQRVGRLVEIALRAPELTATGAYEPDGTFRRRSCCLIYRLGPEPTANCCEDCVLAARSEVRGPPAPSD